MVRSGTDSRDVVVTGMGFCLPGLGRPAITAEDVWEIAAQGKTAITAHEDGAYYGTVDLPAEANAGCSSSSVQINNARLLIGSGASDLIAVTGVDNFHHPLIKKVFDLVRMVQELDGGDRPINTLPDEGMEFNRLTRPYDQRQGCVNYGEDSVTLILESREHAERRGAGIYGQVLDQAITRDGLPHPLACDQSGGDLLMTSQEGCFGHNGAPTGAIGVALTLLMMKHRMVCPTANCEQPLDSLPFNPVPGFQSVPLVFDHALSFSYQIGGVQSAILLGSPDAL